MESNWRMNVWRLGLTTGYTIDAQSGNWSPLYARVLGMVPESYVSRPPFNLPAVPLIRFDPGLGIWWSMTSILKVDPAANFPYGIAVEPD